MPSTAASQLIFFIAAIVVSVSVVGALITTTNTFSGDIRRMGQSAGNSMATNIKIANDPMAMPYNATNNTLALYVMNTGSTTIPASVQSVIVMINGTSFTNLAFVYPKNVKTWAPDVVLTIYVGSVTLPKQDYTLTVLVRGGVTDTISFRIS